MAEEQATHEPGGEAGSQEQGQQTAAEGSGQQQTGGPQQTGQSEQTAEALQGTEYSMLDWRRSLDEPLRQDKGLEPYKDQNIFVRDALNWRSELNRRVRLPADDAPAEEWQKFYKQLPGYPESPNGYREAVELPELPEGQEWDDELVRQFFEMAHQDGYTTRQVKDAMDLFARYQSQVMNVLDAQETQGLIEAEKELQKRFGASLQRKLGAARNYFLRSTNNTDLGSKIWEKIEQSGLGNDPDFIEFYSLQYERFGEPMDLLSDGTFTAMPTTDEINAEKAKALEVINDKKKPVEERRAASGRLQRLNQQLLAMQPASRR